MNVILLRFASICALFWVAAAAPASNAESEADPYLIQLDVRPWIEALRSEDLFVADPAIDALAALGDLAIPALVAALRSEEQLARLHVVEVLRDIRTPATIPALALAARDSDAEVRRDAVTALGKLADPAGQPYLERALGDADPRVSTQAAAACGRLCNSPRAVRRLVEIGCGEPATAAAGARQSVARLISRGKVPQADVAALATEIAVPRMRDTGSAERYDAALMAAVAGLEASLPYLSECARSRVATAPLKAVLCVQALGDSGLAEAIEPLRELADSGDRLLAPAACKGLVALARSNQAARAAAEECAARRKSAARPKRP